jgi:hypothetical protein
MNKKGLLNFSAAIVCLVIIVYFVFFSFVVSSVHAAFPSVDATASNTYLSKVSGFTGGVISSYCDFPRLIFDASTMQKSETIYHNYLECENTDAVLSQASCLSLPGCSFANTNTTYSLWFLKWWNLGGSEINGTCVGYINLSTYGIYSHKAFLGGNYKVDTWDYSDYENDSILLNNTISYLNIAGHETNGISQLVDDGSEICWHPKTLLNKSLCESIECTWTTESTDSSPIKLKTISAMVGSALNYNYVFTFGSAGINLLLGLIFIYIPILILIVAGFYAIFGG